MKGSNWTGRAPRTLSEAFGPYTSPRISETRVCLFAGLVAWVRSFFA